MIDGDVLAAHRQELRRGTIVLACLLLLEQPNYGYALLEALEGKGLAVEANTLYPLLRRLEKQGLLTSEWNTEESRPRKFYVASADGVLLAETLVREWNELHGVLKALKEGA